ncbi:MAG: hypothetical protein QN198_10635 [Armatimonadota bacterium]|nr:hypothetical protein [Armatimonadota bacterium]MDR5704039.1 hypothetical protein [Armatimonadota bacterium]
MNHCSVRHSGQRGFAFITALAVMAVLAIVLAAFVRLMIGDVVLANYQRATTEAFYKAEAGVQEGFFRLKQGLINPLRDGTVLFPSTLDPADCTVNPEDCVKVRVVTHAFGRVIYEITARGTVGGITRRVRLIVVQTPPPALSDSILANEIETQGSAMINKGTLYSHEEIELSKNTWKCSANNIAFTAEEVKYDHTSYESHDAVKVKCPNLYPKSRVALSPSEWENLSPLAVNCSLLYQGWSDDLLCKRKDDDIDDGADNPDLEETFVNWEDWRNKHRNFFPYDFDDRNLNGIYDRGEPFTDLDKDGLYDAGEPYTDLDGDGSYTPPEPITGINDANALLAAIPPWPNMDPMAYWNVADIHMISGDPDNAIAQSTAPEYGPVHDPSRPLIVLDTPSMPINGGTGHGVLLVKGDLKLAGNFVWYGTIYVTGTLEGRGDVVVYGGLIVRKLDLNGNITVYPGFVATEYFPELFGLGKFEIRSWHENR